MIYDTIVVGGGPAGMSAALVLGRSRRRVLVVDAGKPRNYAARHMHNYLSRDGINPRELQRLGRKELATYDVEYREGIVTAATCTDDGFRVTVGRRVLRCRTLLLATGVVDELPHVANLPEFYGVGVHHCPYCDAWEYRDKTIAAYGRGRPGLGLGMSLLTWTDRVLVLTDGVKLTRGERTQAADLGIGVREEPITRLESKRGRARPGKTDTLGRIIFDDGPPEQVAALFFNTGQYQRSRLPIKLGCRTNEDGGVVRDRRQRTGVNGLYLAGDASKDVQFVIVAAAEGAKAGMAINTELQKRDRAAGRRGSA